MRNKLAKQTRKYAALENEGLPLVGYEVVNKQVKMFKDLIGNPIQYETGTLQMKDCVRKRYKALKKQLKKENV